MPSVGVLLLLIRIRFLMPSHVLSLDWSPSLSTFFFSVWNSFLFIYLFIYFFFFLFAATSSKWVKTFNGKSSHYKVLGVSIVGKSSLYLSVLLPVNPKWTLNSILFQFSIFFDFFPNVFNVISDFHHYSTIQISVGLRRAYVVP